MCRSAKELLGISLFSFGLIVSTAYAANKSRAACDVPELFGKDDSDYNRLVCKGVDHLQRQQYQQAASVFELAMRETLYDSPNFVLYPRLALAYFRSGDIAKAKATLKKGEIALSIYIGAVKCPETELALELVKRAGSHAERAAYESPFWSEVSKRMCGAMYDILYSYRSFDSVLADAKMVQFYLDIKKESEGDSNLQE